MSDTVQKKVVASSTPPSNPFTDIPPNTGVRDEPIPQGPSTRSKSDTELIIASLTQLYTGIGQAVFIFLDPVDGQTIVRESEDLAESWRNLLDNDPKLRRIMKGAIKGGGWGTVLTAHLAVAMPIITHHQGALEHLVRGKRNSETDTEADTPAH